MSDPEDLGDALALVQCQFRMLGYTWDSPRVQDWLRRLGKTRYELSLADLESLGRQLPYLVNQATEEEIFTRQIQYNFGRWEAMLQAGKVSPQDFIEELKHWRESYRNYPEAIAELQRLINERRNAARKTA